MTGPDPGSVAGQLGFLLRRFVADAFEALEVDRVIPTSRFNPHIRVGSDYFGGPIMRSETFGALEKALKVAFPDRFADAAPGEIGDFPGHYLFDLVEAAVYRCSVGDQPYDASSLAVEESVNELIDVLSQSTTCVSVARVVTHLDTATGEPCTFDGLTVTPVDSRDVLRAISDVIPRTGAAVGMNQPSIHDTPLAVVHLSVDTSGSPWEATEQLSEQLSAFMRAVRLLTATTSQSVFEIRGPTSRISRMSPYLLTFQGASGSLGSLIRRTAKLHRGAEASIAAVLGMLSESTGNRDGKLISSFDLAFRMFDRSHQDLPWFERIVDLSTALEATLIGDDKESAGLTLRLRQRAAALLACDGDPAGSIFKDVDVLYGLRSTLVHGGDLSQRQLSKAMDSLSTILPDTPRGEATERSVDRLRDLVRRSILARLALGWGSDPLWPFDGAVSVDRELADDVTRNLWRDTWQKRMLDVGAQRSGLAARIAADGLSPDDR